MTPPGARGVAHGGTYRRISMAKERLVDRILCKLGFHAWEVHQHNIRADEDRLKVFVITWKQCVICAESRIIFILE